MEDKSLCTYQAIIWPKDSSAPGERITLLARNLEDASAQVQAQFGENVVVSLWNEEDADAAR
ncbi:hypothetical protein HZ992_15105 [Rhizobacter sp. AJA081-3]|uniref:hypothetical protein n=1 Tax=Rhizobacter sp. AJA081-3 TaxID=2753607 RepID=UPI001AE040D6|nr:hypothetical protein [Rhizobacter sp. AJA081-3]QTN21512.1 hypothetical protein HZ992_15105 [Rhizobacter sp. AJA081-3]